jgi:hypothetical protein
MILEALNYARYTEGSLLNNALIRAREGVEKNGHHIADCRERVFGDVATAVCGSGHGCALSACGEKVEVCETSGQATFAYDRRREFDTDLLQGGESLLSKINEMDLQQFLAQHWHSTTVDDTRSCSRKGFHQVCNASAS